MTSKESTLARSVALAVGILTLVGMVAGAVLTFETKDDHKSDLDKQEKLYEALIENSANRAADAAIDKWVNRKRGRE